MPQPSEPAFPYFLLHTCTPGLLIPSRDGLSLGAVILPSSVAWLEIPIGPCGFGYIIAVSVTRYFLRGGVVDPTPNSQPGGPVVFCRDFPSLSTRVPVILRRRTLASRRCHSAAEAFPGATMTGTCDMRLQWQSLWIDGRHFSAFSRRTLVALVNPTETFYHCLEPPGYTQPPWNLEWGDKHFLER